MNFDRAKTTVVVNSQDQGCRVWGLRAEGLGFKALGFKV